jgi:formylglycine-generating enzyme required for sulfatase activity
MRLFLSYARVDQPIAIQIAEALSGLHEVWLDERLYAGQRWWDEIRRRLAWCEGFVYLLSPESVSSEYCLKELKIAQETDRMIFPVLIRRGTEVPHEVRDIQYADLSNGLTFNAGAPLLNAIHMSELQGYNRPQPRKPDQQYPGAGYRTRDDDEPVQARTNVTAIITKAADAMEAGRYDEAVFLLKRAIEQGVQVQYISLDNMLREAEAGLEEQMRKRANEMEYYSIVELVRRKRTRPIGIASFLNFHRDHPDFDPEGLAELVNADESYDSESVPRPVMKPRPRPVIPMLEWCEIPAGKLLIVSGKNGHSRKDVLTMTTFYVSRYPVTNAQYDVFLNDEQGYANVEWWSFSGPAQAWRAKNVIPITSKYQGDNRPRENVSWYDAMAFCAWLSAKTALQITLPTRQQWQLAARGDDNRLYPWGDTFDIQRSNTLESKVRMTSEVMRYGSGVSPYGVFDMAGNVWEWCLNMAYDDVDVTHDKPRGVHGGSFMSPFERAQNHSYLPLSPETHYGSIGFRLVCLR